MLFHPTEDWRRSSKERKARERGRQEWKASKSGRQASKSPFPLDLLR